MTFKKHKLQSTLYGKKKLIHRVYFNELRELNVFWGKRIFNGENFSKGGRCLLLTHTVMVRLFLWSRGVTTIRKMAWSTLMVGWGWEWYKNKSGIINAILSLKFERIKRKQIVKSSVSFYCLINITGANIANESDSIRNFITPKHAFAF